MTNHPVFTRTYHDRTVMVFEVPSECRCHRMAAVFVNRMGQTRCLNCEREVSNASS